MQQSSARFYPYPVHYCPILFNSVTIAYCDEGPADAPVLLFIHGLGHNFSAWQRNISYLKQYYRCIAIDLPGNGSSSRSMDYPYSMHFFASCIKELIHELGLERVYLCGHSMGGQIAFTLAAQNMPQVKGLVQCAPAGIETFNDWERSLYKSTMALVDMLSSEENSLRKAIQNSFYILSTDIQPFIHNLLEQLQLHPKEHYRKMMEACIGAMLDEPVSDRFADIAVPVYILFGEKDGLIPNRFIHPVSVRQLVLSAQPSFRALQYEIIPRCGHFVQWEKAADVNHYIHSFIKEQEQKN
jgi:pimeloyl-ACP methyl ester carboxylesterase